jgi:hypothetical protein
MALGKRLLLLFVLCLSLLLQGGAAQTKHQRLGPRKYGQRLVWSYDELTDFEFLRNYAQNDEGPRGYRRKKKKLSASLGPLGQWQCAVPSRVCGRAGAGG